MTYLAESHTGPTEYAVETPPLHENRSGVGIVEGWCGTIVHPAEIDANARITRNKIVDPSWVNWPARRWPRPTPSSPTSRWPPKASTCPMPATSFNI